MAQDAETPSIALAQEATYQKALRDAVNGGAGRQGIEQASRTFVGSEDFAAEPGSTPPTRTTSATSARSWPRPRRTGGR
ncbi:hypothetical protein ACIA8K_22705 [Catenuloplanes sp. NPDC051500]|uniref:hypothetical protein n=1 Tax=Catenuloplanes sp. NPDC051500 TaxID=3363959 RepID=UPI0037933FC9